MLREEVSSQSRGVSVSHVVDPSADGGVQLRERYLAGIVEVDVVAQPSGELHCVSAFQPSEVGVDDES